MFTFIGNGVAFVGATPFVAGINHDVISTINYLQGTAALMCYIFRFCLCKKKRQADMDNAVRIHGQ